MLIIRLHYTDYLYFTCQEGEMFRLGIIEESLENKEILDLLKPYFFSQRIEEVPEDVEPLWHTNEYHMPDDKIKELIPCLEKKVKSTWYIHTFNDDVLIVILHGKSFQISKKRDESWNDMIEYGVKVANVERHFLENVPLHM